jgi:hypothetical protein
MKALLFVSLLTFAMATAAKAEPLSSYQYPHYPKWAEKAFEPRR